LNFSSGEVLAMNLLSMEHEIHERHVEQRLDVGNTPARVSAGGRGGFAGEL
jgi:hypothetical protein